MSLIPVAPPAAAAGEAQRRGITAMEFTRAQISALEQIQARGFALVAYPMFANCVGVRKGNCAVLLAPVESAGFRLFGEPAYLINGNLAVRVARGGSESFVFKKDSVPATSERIAELRAFAAEIGEILHLVE